MTALDLPKHPRLEFLPAAAVCHGYLPVMEQILSAHELRSLISQCTLFTLITRFCLNTDAIRGPTLGTVWLIENLSASVLSKEANGEQTVWILLKNDKSKFSPSTFE